MIASFPSGYRCPPAIREMYPEIERGMMPLIKRKAAKINRYMPSIAVEDAIQDARLALLSCLMRYDINKCNMELKRYVGVAMANTFHCMVYEALAKRRMPVTIVRDDSTGEWIKVPRAPMSLDALVGGCDLIDDEAVDAEEALVERERQLRFQELRMKLKHGLKGHDLDVYRCSFETAPDFTKMVENSGGDPDHPSNLDIARYLGLGKNTVDWSLNKIKEALTRLVKVDEFSDLFQETIRSKGWPMIHISNEPKHDKEFVCGIVEKRHLDPKPVKDYHLRSDFAEVADEGEHKRYWARLIERYSWGVVVVIKQGDEYRTMVIEGRFNALTGYVFGVSGARERVPVDWYTKLAKKLNGGADSDE